MASDAPPPSAEKPPRRMPQGAPEVGTRTATTAALSLVWKGEQRLKKTDETSELKRQSGLEAFRTGTEI